MEFLSVLLSSLLFIGSPVGVVLDQVAEDAIRARLVDVEEISVRVDNASALRLLQGKVDKVRIGARGVYPIDNFRVAIADLETDAIDLDFGNLKRGRVVLDHPLNGAVHVVITPEDLNAFLQSPTFSERLERIPINLGTAAQSRDAQRYQLTNPEAAFLPDNRLRLKFDLADRTSIENIENTGGATTDSADPEPDTSNPDTPEPFTLSIVAETGFSIEDGHRLMLIDPQVSVNGNEAPAQLLETFTENLGDRLSLRQLEDEGVTLRILNASLEPEDLDLALWVQIDPSFTR
ncbi:MAG: DUF2993 domain-containing protein [Cyanobacteria bacterium P01_G01_bin.38]